MRHVVENIIYTSINLVKNKLFFDKRKEVSV